MSNIAKAINELDKLPWYAKFGLVLASFMLAVIAVQPKRK